MGQTIVVQNARPSGTQQKYNITAAAVVKAFPGVLSKISCNVACTTFTVNDCATTGAAAASNQIWSGALTAGQVLPLDWPCKTGIVVSAITGTGAAVAISYG